MTLEPLAPDERQQKLAELLQQAMGAHAQYETGILKRPDSNWARWVAGFILDRSIGRDLARMMTEGQLAELLEQLDRDYRANGNEQSRQDYFVEHLSEAIGWAEPTQIIT